MVVEENEPLSFHQLISDVDIRCKCKRLIQPLLRLQDNVSGILSNMSVGLEPAWFIREHHKCGRDADGARHNGQDSYAECHVTLPQGWRCVRSAEKQGGHDG